MTAGLSLKLAASCSFHNLTNNAKARILLACIHQCFHADIHFHYWFSWPAWNIFSVITSTIHFCSQCQNCDLIVVPFFCWNKIASIKKPLISWLCYKHHCFVCGWPVSGSLDRRALVDDRSFQLTKLRFFVSGSCECKDAIDQDTLQYHQVW